ncbi:MAG: hypothetical protein FD133_1346 [Erysipelotrichaceae bacterium]|nr:MAG: hypothetical protein FD179_1458 [Erysipelotrichaceae bacterium]TXT17536.1 MAG: hypothetical protein FD133_1346 [Erysipelotrichaceae bacterium]
MINFVDILKKSFLENGQMADLSVVNIFMSLISAFICSMIIYYVYRKFYRGVVYSSSFNILLVLVSVVTSFIVMTISSNILLSLGMVGALSIVRFRTAVKDPLDVGFLFFAIAVGITSGAGLYILSFIATLFISLIYILLVQVKTFTKVFLLIVKFENSANEEVQKILKPLKGELKNKTTIKDTIELTLELRIKKDNTAYMTQLTAIQGVKSAVLVEYTGDFGE